MAGPAASHPSSHVLFPTTHWSLVLRARDSAPESRPRALEELLGTYWRPVYSFFRRKGLSATDAEDAVQEFFTRLLERDWLERVDENRGRFRGFLMTAAARFLKDDRVKEAARKRGGGWRRVPMDFAEAEAGVEKCHGDPPEEAFRREWARTVFLAALARLKMELDKTGHADWFDSLREFYGVEGGLGEVPYETIAKRRGVSPGDVANALARSRRRLRDLVLDEVRRSVTSEHDLAEELRDLFERWR